MEDFFAKMAKISSLDSFSGQHPTQTHVEGAGKNRPEGRLEIFSKRDQVNAPRPFRGVDRPGARPTSAAYDP
jgi:hypothetical protein